MSTGENATNDAESFIDNISLEYRLDRTGTRYVRLFYDKTTRVYSKARLRKQESVWYFARNWTNSVNCSSLRKEVSMKGIYNNILASCLIGIILFSGCSVTKHLPEGEVLYTGGKRW